MIAPSLLTGDTRTYRCVPVVNQFRGSSSCYVSDLPEESDMGIGLTPMAVASPVQGQDWKTRYDNEGIQVDTASVGGADGAARARSFETVVSNPKEDARCS